MPQWDSIGMSDDPEQCVDCGSYAPVHVYAPICHGCFQFQVEEGTCPVCCEKLIEFDGSAVCSTCDDVPF